MKIQPECVPCLLKRIIFETGLGTSDKKRQAKALRQACKTLAENYDPKECSATLATRVHKRVYQTLQNNDPYAPLKQTSNLVATSLVPKVERLIHASTDPLRTSMICAIIGNMMDYGIDGSNAHPRMLEEVFDTLYAEGLGYDDYSRLRERINRATHLVLFTDNCGEIVFDKIMCRELKSYNSRLLITAVVKGKPVLSDATMKDAKAIRLQAVVDQVDTTGCFAVGVDFSQLPTTVKTALKLADLIICKGMANYESFSETSYKPVVYLLRIKCNAIAASMKLPRNISAIKVYE